MEGGLREQKKQRTRDAIVAAAMRLFDERGFDQTTIADIAAAADIAPRTFFGYFPSKEAVAFPTFDADYAALERRLDERPAEVTTIDVLSSFCEAYVDDPDFNKTKEQKRHLLISKSDALAAYERNQMARFGDLLSRGIARDLGVAPDSTRARMTAAAAIAAMESLSDVVGGDEELENPLESLYEALDFIRGGMAALQDRQPPR